MDIEPRLAMWTRFINEHQYSRIAEVGVWKGEFARHLLLSCSCINSYALIDSWRHLEGWNKPFNISDDEFECVYRQAMDSVAFARDKVRLLRGTTLEVREKIEDQSLDFVYIDGDHSLRGIVIDAISMWPKLREGGVLAGDDFTDDVWQHSRNYEPSLVNPFMRYFADAVGETLHVLPGGQFLLKKSRTNSVGEATDGSAVYGLLPLLKIASDYGAKKNHQTALIGFKQAKNLAKAAACRFSSRYREYEATARHHERFPECFLKTGIAFIHVPKAAGTSISMALYGIALGHRSLAKWQDMFPHSMRKVETMAVLRDPVARFVSACYFLKGGGMNESDRAFALKHLNDFNEPSELACALVDPGLQSHVLSYFHFKKQVDFLKDTSGRIAINCLVRLEDLSRAEKWASKKVGHQINFDQLNPGSTLAKQCDIDKYALSILIKIYREDFELYSAMG
jgi:hypothetical protein